MTYPLPKFTHLPGLTLMGAGLIGVWYLADHHRVRGLGVPRDTVARGDGCPVRL
jgi:hypothetical protein